MRSPESKDLACSQLLVDLRRLETTRRDLQVNRRKNVNNCFFPKSLLRSSCGMDLMVVRSLRTYILICLVLSFGIIVLRKPWRLRRPSGIPFDLPSIVIVSVY